MSTKQISAEEWLDRQLNHYRQADEIFHENAEADMVQYNHSEFKRTHPTLYRVILQSMDEYAKLYHEEMMENL